MITGFTSAQIADQAGKTFFITGANTGIGFEVARAIAGRGGRVLLGCRDRTRADEACARILREHPGADVSVVEFDLADLSSVGRFAVDSTSALPRRGS